MAKSKIGNKAAVLLVKENNSNIIKFLNIYSKQFIKRIRSMGLRKYSRIE